LNKKTVVRFGGLPGCVFSAPLPNADGTAVPYSQMRVGSDDVLPLAKDAEVGVEIEHDEHMPHYQVVALAYRMLLNAVVEATYQEFMAARCRIVEEARDSAQL